VTLRIPNVGELSRKEREDNHPLFDQKKGAKFIDDLKRLAKSFPDTVTKIRELTGAAEGDFLIVVAGDPAHHIKASDTKFEGRLSEREINVYMAAGNFRSELAKKYADRHKAFTLTDELVQNAESRSANKLDGAKAFHPIWIVDFPMFEYDLASGKWMPAHHPFTAPYEADMANLTTDPASVRADCYDLAMNGLELGSGSIRIHRKDVQERAFSVIGLSEAEAQSQFGFLLEAFNYGPPPHGGIAFGLDRLVALLTGADTIRDVMAFPKTATGGDPLTGAPTPITPAQRKEAGVDAVYEPKGGADKKDAVAKA